MIAAKASGSRRRFLTAFAGAATAWALPRWAHAAPPVEIRTQMNPQRVPVGGRAQLTIEVTSRGGGDLDIHFEAPESVETALISKHSSRGGSSSFSISFGSGGSALGNARPPQGGSTRSVTHVYLVQPSTPGQILFKVGAFAGGDLVLADPQPVLSVTGQAAPAPAPAPSPGVGSQPTDTREDLFAWSSATPEEVFVGEPFTYSLDIWDRGRQRFQYSLSQRPSFKDFWTEDIDRPRERRGRINNRVYRVSSAMSRVLFPQKAGELQVGACSLTASPFGGFFFSSGPTLELPAHAVTVKVKPLPAKGQPPNFRAHNVGRFKLATKVDRKSVTQGDALKLTVQLQGQGNIRLAEPETWPALAGFSRYDPEASAPTVNVKAGQVSGRRSWTFLVIAEEAGTLTIPEHAISFFDPGTQRYETHSSKAIEIQVAPKAGYDAAPSDAATGEPGQAHQDEDPLAGVTGASALARTSASEAWLTPARFDRMALGLIGVTGAAALGRSAWRRFGPDDVAKRRAAAVAWRAEQHATMQSGLESGEGFWSAAAQLMQARAMATLGAGFEGLTRKELAAALAEAGLPLASLDAWRAVLDRADAARFGAGAGANAERSEAMEAVMAATQDPVWGPWDD